MSKNQSFLRNPQLDGSPFYWQKGEVAILCLHGFSATTVEVRTIAAYFSNQGYTTRGPLLPGHGSTPLDMNKTKWKDWLGTAENSLQELMRTYQKIFILGESMGGLLTLHLAAKYPSILGVMVFAPAIKIHNLWLARWLWPFKPYLNKGKPNDTIPQQSYKVFPLKAAASLYDLQRIVREELQKITVPILLFQGKKDYTVDPEGAVYCIDHVASQDKEFVILEESAHIILLDRQLPFVEQKCSEFIQSHLE